MARALWSAAAFACLGALGVGALAPTGSPSEGTCRAAGCPEEELEELAWLQTAGRSPKVTGASATSLRTAASASTQPARSEKRTVHIATTSCVHAGRVPGRAFELQAMVKSVAANADPDRTYHIHAFTNDALRKALGGWPASDEEALRRRGVFVDMREADMKSEFVNSFRICDTERLHLPVQLPGVDAVIYVDSDTLWQVDPGVLWDHFWEFNASQHMAFALERENPKINVYEPRDFLMNGSFPTMGFNAGVMLWNLTRARQLGDRDRVLDTIRHDRRVHELVDQDALNLYAYAEPYRFFVLPCRYNLRANSFCVSNPARDEPVLLHGNCGYFHQGSVCLGHRDFRTSFTAALKWDYKSPIQWPKC